MNVRVLIVDDVADSRATLRRALSLGEGIEVAGEAGSGEEAILQTEALRPHVVLMDVRMPTIDGIAATEEITRRFPEVRVLALTAHDDSESVRQMLTAGASGYLLKGSPVGDLVAAVRKAREGGGQVDERVLPKVLDDLRHLLQQERDRRAEVERLARRREEFIQVLSHELRTPLTVIGGALQYLRGAELPEDGAELVESALRRVSDLERVAEGLELVGQGPPALDAGAVPAEAIEQALAGLERPDTVEASDEAWAGISASHFARVARELVTNAMRHGRRPVTVRAWREGRTGILEVTDAGDFEPDPQLFDPFVQGDMSTRRRQGGLGLGLFVAQRLCESAGGELEMRREDGRTVALARFLLAG